MDEHPGNNKYVDLYKRAKTSAQEKFTRMKRDNPSLAYILTNFGKIRSRFEKFTLNQSFDNSNLPRDVAFRIDKKENQAIDTMENHDLARFGLSIDSLNRIEGD